MSELPTRPWPRVLGWVPVWQRNVLVWRKLAAASLFGNFGEPLLYLLALGYGMGSLIGEVGGMPYLHYLASGIVCASSMMTASFEGTYSAYSRMAVQRTWDAILTAPLSIADVVTAETVWAASKALLSAGAILVVATAMGVTDGPAAARFPRQGGASLQRGDPGRMELRTRAANRARPEGNGRSPAQRRDGPALLGAQ